MSEGKVNLPATVYAVAALYRRLGDGRQELFSRSFLITGHAPLTEEEAVNRITKEISVEYPDFVLLGATASFIVVGEKT